MKCRHLLKIVRRYTNIIGSKYNKEDQYRLERVHDIAWRRRQSVTQTTLILKIKFPPRSLTVYTSSPFKM